jgi:hypothetical protein
MLSNVNILKYLHLHREVRLFNFTTGSLVKSAMFFKIKTRCLLEHLVSMVGKCCKFIQQVASGFIYPLQLEKSEGFISLTNYVPCSSFS